MCGRIKRTVANNLMTHQRSAEGCCHLFLQFIHHNEKRSGLLSLVASLHPAQALNLRASSNNATSKKNDHAPTTESLRFVEQQDLKRTKCITFRDAPPPSISSHNKRHTNKLDKKN
jgi:hypothetical protein